MAEATRYKKMYQDAIKRLRGMRDLEAGHAEREAAHAKCVEDFQREVADLRVALGVARGHVKAAGEARMQAEVADAALAEACGAHAVAWGEVLRAADAGAYAGDGSAPPGAEQLAEVMRPSMISEIQAALKAEHDMVKRLEAAVEAAKRENDNLNRHIVVLKPRAARAERAQRLFVFESLLADLQQFARSVGRDATRVERLPAADASKSAGKLYGRMVRWFAATRATFRACDPEGCTFMVLPESAEPDDAATTTATATATEEA